MQYGSRTESNDAKQNLLQLKSSSLGVNFELVFGKSLGVSVFLESLGVNQELKFRDSLSWNYGLIFRNQWLITFINGWRILDCEL